MTVDERYKYLRKIENHYLKGDRKARRRLPDEMAQATGLHRKSRIRLLSTLPERTLRTPQRGKTYGSEVDAAIAEQCNANPVRAYAGYHRFEAAAQTLALNKIYELMWLCQNFVQPVMRVVEKTVVAEEAQPKRIRRGYDQARTPLARLCELRVLAPDVQAQLEPLFSLPCRTPDRTEVGYETLSGTPDPRPERQAAQ